MPDFLKENSPLPLEWEKIESLPFEGEGSVIGVPWFRDGKALYCYDPDGLAIALDREKGLVLMARGSCQADAASKLDGDDGWSEQIQALTPERALVIARELIRLAYECRKLREGDLSGED